MLYAAQIVLHLKKIESYALERSVVFAAPLDEVGVLYSNGETLLPDVNGLQHPSMPQLG